MKTVALSNIVELLDRELDTTAFAADSSHNGLQVENSGQISKICCGVDASLEFLEQAHAAGANLCVVHHGLSWGPSLARITGLNYRLISFLIQHDMALYASHLPLDAHASLGNNALLARKLGLRHLAPFGEYKGMTIGFRGTLPRAISSESFAKRLATATPGGNLVAMPFGNPMIRTVGVISGGADNELPQAIAAGLDAYVSGEVGLQAYNEARHGQINAFFAGHYATETFGVKALGELLERRFSLPTEFIDLQLPY